MQQVFPEDIQVFADDSQKDYKIGFEELSIKYLILAAFISFVTLLITLIVEILNKKTIHELIGNQNQITINHKEAMIALKGVIEGINTSNQLAISEEL